MYNMTYSYRHTYMHKCTHMQSFSKSLNIFYSTQAFNMETNLTWNVSFDGFTQLSINVPVHGEISSIKLINDTEPTVMLIEGTV